MKLVPTWVTVWGNQLTHILTHTKKSKIATTNPRKPKFSRVFGADRQIRTADLILTNSFSSDFSCCFFLRLIVQTHCATIITRFYLSYLHLSFRPLKSVFLSYLSVFCLCFCGCKKRPGVPGLLVYSKHNLPIIIPYLFPVQFLQPIRLVSYSRQQRFSILFQSSAACPRSLSLSGEFVQFQQNHLVHLGTILFLFWLFGSPHRLPYYQIALSHHL